jgi:hypothetical protein
MQFKIAGDPSTVAEIRQALAELEASVVDVQPGTTHRDFSILQVLITAVIGSAVKVAFDQIVAVIQAALSKKEATAKLVISINGQTIELRTSEDVEKLRAALSAV